jgi:hypothetical protein
MQTVRISICIIFVFFAQEISAMLVDSFSISKTLLTHKFKKIAGKSISGSVLKGKLQNDYK